MIGYIPKGSIAVLERSNQSQFSEEVVHFYSFGFIHQPFSISAVVMYNTKIILFCDPPTALDVRIGY